MKNTVYLGDIDPNNTILPVMDIRRTLMFQLLVWDKIVLSDSQFLTDPRLNVLMSGYDGDEVYKKYGLSDVHASQKGIETLFEKGLIEVALRKRPDKESNLLDTWSGMKSSPKKVPYLPEDENYVKYLHSLSCNTHTYDLSSMSALFQDKLMRGIDTDPAKGGLVLHKNDAELELRRMFSEQNPLFRNILDFLCEQQLQGNISPERFQKLYDYVYSCYNVNVPTALNCNVNTRFSHIPFHIQSGEEYYGNNITEDQLKRLRPTWAFNPIFFDNMTFEEFAEIRSHLRTHRIREFYLNSVQSSWAEIEDAWDDYTYLLEQCIKRTMLEKKDDLQRRIFVEFGNDKFLTSPRQYTLTSPIFEIAKSVVSPTPIGNIYGIVESFKNIWGSVVALSKRNERIALAEDFTKLSSLVAKETRVVTKYNNPFSK